MSAAEVRELQDRISKLTNRINRHKESQHNGGSYGLDYSVGGRGSYHRSAPYPQQAYQGRGRFAPTYRNKTLVLNGGPQPAPSVQENQPSNPPTPSWVTKNDRHLQLINRDIYERDSQHRTQAIEQSLKQKHINRGRQEKAQFLGNMRQASGDSVTAYSNPSRSSSRYEVEVEGVRFYVTKQGSKLVKAPDDLNPPSATPKLTLLFGVKFHRTKNGNLVRHGVVQARRSAGGVKKVKENCKAFSWTGTCPKGPTCRYIHDISKTAICRTWLGKGDCPKGDNCDLSHDITEERTPLCMHFANGNCNNPSCPYIHAEHSPADPVCRTFGIYGYCEKGAKCLGRHVFECPDFSNNGVCKLKGCKRPHIERASILRKANKQTSSEEIDDLSSEDEDMMDSDDVDSDEVEEFIGHDDEDLSFAEQKDFIGFA
ncbi:putative CCCH zinc finger protein [Rosellinia necatrix]|uniref:Putative CCCH zinc finger protein n=1 Tax=Rosellinia necatrix TaxID=77044 RepID=A0A1W2TE77_ROSNE|nr:putative CCCH zinc finger protein [Rosellinia necatrix]